MFTKKTCIYLRVSTNRQADDGFGLDAQEERCRGYCIYKGIPNDLIDIFIDGGYSGGNTDRPSFEKMMQGIEDGIYERVIIYKLDRISRSIIDFSKILKYFSERGIELVSVSESLDLSTAIGEMIAKILVVFAEYERQLVIERTVESFKAMLTQGLYPFGGKSPLGYIRIDKKLIVDPKDKLVYQDLKNTYLEVKSISQTYSEMILRHPEYKWSEDRILGILKNKVYLGGVEFRGEWYPNLHEPLITQDEYDRIIKLFGRHNTERKHIYMLRGIIYCANCGRPMSATCAYNHSQKLYLYYECKHCHHSVSENKVMEQIKFDDIKNKAKPVMNEEFHIKIDGLNKEINRLNMKQKDIFDGYMNDELSRTDYTSTVSMISAKKKPLIKSIKRLEKIQENEWLSKFTTTNTTNRFLLIHKSIEYVSWDFEENQIAEIKFISKSA